MSLFDRYGIKEVADVTFYELNENNPGKPGKPVLYLDTLKVSTIEQTAENTEARGGKGNAPLMTWDFGKEITVNLEDALFSNKSMALMYGGELNESTNEIFRTTFINVNEKILVWNESSGTLDAVNDTTYKFGSTNSNSTVIDGKTFNGTVDLITDRGVVFNPWSSMDGEDAQAVLADPSFEKSGNEVYLKPGIYICRIEITPKKSTTIEVSANTFPGVYYVTGDTFVRNEKTGKDELFQIIMPKVKVLSENNTLTLEADGEPTVFGMTLKVLKSKNKPMMSLVQYDAIDTELVNQTELTYSRNRGADGDNQFIIDTNISCDYETIFVAKAMYDNGEGWKAAESTDAHMVYEFVSSEDGSNNWRLVVTDDFTTDEDGVCNYRFTIMYY